jgi:S1-C subfamily serine protease
MLSLALLAGLVMNVRSVAAQTSLIETLIRHKAAIVTVNAHLPPNGPGSAMDSAAQGAGVIIDARGIIVTNLHTVKFSDKVIVELLGGELHPARIIELWPQQDLALLAISAGSSLDAIVMADSDTLQLGEEIINIGTSVFRKESVCGGRITGLGRSHTTDTLEVIRVDLDVYQGDSGGPLFNRRGELIGMLSAKDGSQPRHAYAIPSNKIKNLYLKAVK